ncbi:hypothetical protein [Kitasatospora sp. NPDC097643]|uniref:hypothetical protein n=1 Tax=Kitasatospora sp. NPDC097643 TaxID=3157230 RepID=UPI00333371C9
MLSREAVVGYVCEYLEELREELSPGEVRELLARIGRGEATAEELTGALERAGFAVNEEEIRSTPLPSLPGGRLGDPDAVWGCPGGRCERRWQRRFVGQPVPACGVDAAPLRRG